MAPEGRKNFILDAISVWTNFVEEKNVLMLDFSEE